MMKRTVLNKLTLFLLCIAIGLTFTRCKVPTLLIQSNTNTIEGFLCLKSNNEENLFITTRGDIEENDITVRLDAPAVITSLIASFEASDKSTVKVGNTVQISGETVQDFSDPVQYTVIAENETSRTYTVTVIIES